MNGVIFPGVNWVRKRGSVDQKRRMSGMEKRTMESRSRPRPKAQPDLWDWPGARAKRGGSGKGEGGGGREGARGGLVGGEGVRNHRKEGGADSMARRPGELSNSM